ncbi:MAG: RNA-binding protein [Pseudomonadota bacterium]
MANTNLFPSLRGRFLPPADAINEAGGTAYALGREHCLAQYAATGCLNGTFYASAEAQLDAVMALCEDVDPAFIAKTAVYCRERGYMKDMPALLLAALTVRGPQYLPAVFGRVIDNGKMLRTFVQILRSGAAGRKSLGTRPKKLVQQWLNTADERALLSASVGTSPSLADVVKMVHPKPAQAWRAAFFARLIGKPYDVSALPPVTQALEAYKLARAEGRQVPAPAVPFQMLASLDLDAQAWAEVARHGGWQMVRMNLNTFARHGVFALPGMADEIAAKLRQPDAIARARVFPYQLLAAYHAAGEDMPSSVREALQDALELALANVPLVEGRMVVCPDVSGSMHSPVTGYRAGSSSAVRCVDAAALVAATFLRKQPDTMVLPFKEEVVKLALNPRDTVMTNAQKMAAIGAGGTNCSAPLAWLNHRRVSADVVMLVSDNQSWMDARHGETATLREWERFRQRNPKARLVCLDMQPYASSQAPERDDILNIGGFSDSVFQIVAAFAAGQLQAGHWVGEISATAL